MIIFKIFLHIMLYPFKFVFEILISPITMMISFFKLAIFAGIVITGLMWYNGMSWSDITPSYIVSKISSMDFGKMVSKFNPFSNTSTGEIKDQISKYMKDRKYSASEIKYELTETRDNGDNIYTHYLKRTMWVNGKLLNYKAKLREDVNNNTIKITDVDW